MTHTKKSITTLIVLTLMLGLINAGHAQAVEPQTWTVNSTADPGSGSCGSTCTLRDAISDANSGDTIVFDSGLSGDTITLGSTLTIDKNLTIDGTGLIANINISGGNAVRVFQVNSGSVELNRLNIINGSAGGGSGIYNSSEMTISNSNIFGHADNALRNSGTMTILNSTISDNQAADSGGGIYNTHNLTVINSTFSGNSTGSVNFGGGIFHTGSGELTVLNSTFSENIADKGGGIFTYGTTTVVNSTFSANEAGYGGGFYNNGTATILNSTFYGNIASTFGNGLYNDGTLNLKNTILYHDHSADTKQDCYNASGNTIASEIGNILSPMGPDHRCGTLGSAADPLLDTLDDNGGYTQTHALLSGSPAIDGGDNGVCADAATVNNQDQRGITRPQNSLCDIGAYEYYTGIYYTKPAASGTGNCSSWDNACTLQTALKIILSGDEIWAMEGTHNPTTSDPDPRTSTFQLKNGVAVYGGFDGTETARSQRDPATHLTTLSGDIGTLSESSDNSYHVVTGSGTDSSAILDGFTVSGGNANGSSPDNNGGGMYNDSGSPTLTNVTLSGNSTNDVGEGGGMFNDNSSSPILTNVTLSGNSANNGGGMFNGPGSSPSLTNVTLSDNSAYWDGGGMHNGTGSSPNLTNVTFSGNSADYGGGMYNDDFSSPSLTNVTLSGNSAGYYGGGIYNDNSSSPSLTKVTLSGNSATNGGGMYNDNSSPSLTKVTLSGNSATNQGGGMYNDNSSPSLTNVTLSGNSASVNGGGMYNYNNSNPILVNVTFSSNQADYGGGMYNEFFSSPTLTNVTLSGNSATNDGGGMYNYDGSSPNLTNVTFSGNSAGSGGGMYNYEQSYPSLTNVIIADSPSGGDCVNVDSSLGYGSGNNLIEDATHACGLTNGEDGNIIGSDPKLRALANYGGWNKTRALKPGSPALDAGDNSECPSTDQRGVTRPQGLRCDIGAFELEQSSRTFKSVGKYDGWVLESGESTGKGGTKNKLGKVLLLGDNAQDKQYRVILSFGTAALPDNAVIISVVLKVKFAGKVGKNPMSTHNGLVVDIKKNKFFTLPALQINDFQAKPGKFKVGKFAKRLYSGWYRSVLYKGARAYINKNGRTQLRLRFLMDDDNDNVADILKLYSGNAILVKRPQLIVRYYVP